MNPGESPADAIVRHLSGVRARELWVVANDLRDKLLKIDAEIEELDSGNEDNLTDERLDELERAEEEDNRRLESVEAALERALVDASTVKTTSPSKQDNQKEDEKNKAAPIATATATSPLLSSLLQSSSTSSKASEATEDATSEVTAVESKVEGDPTAKSTAETESASSEVAASEAVKVEEEGEEMVDVEKDNKGWVHQSRPCDLISDSIKLDLILYETEFWTHFQKFDTKPNLTPPNFTNEPSKG